MKFFIPGKATAFTFLKTAPAQKFFRCRRPILAEIKSRYEISGLGGVRIELCADRSCGSIPPQQMLKLPALMLFAV